MNAASLYRKLARIREAERRTGKVTLVGTKDGRKMVSVITPNMIEGVTKSWESHGFTVTIEEEKQPCTGPHRPGASS